MYDKLFRKSPSFEIIKNILLGLWKAYGPIHISDMPNRYLLIRCASKDSKQQILFGGPWTVNGIALQLVPWQPFFEPAFTKLTKAMVWLQFHNMHVELWDRDSLETLTEPIGKLMKIDKWTSSLSHTRFARVCLEIDFAQPLKRGIWIEDGDARVFFMILYE